MPGTEAGEIASRKPNLTVHQIQEVRMPHGNWKLLQREPFNDLPALVANLQQVKTILTQTSVFGFSAAIVLMLAHGGVGGRSMQQEGGLKVLRVSSFGKSDTKSEADALDRSGDAILSLVQHAADVTREDCDRALSMAHQLSLQLKASEDRADKLEAKVKQLEQDAQKAEDWLTHIYKQIEGKFFQEKDLQKQ